MKWYGRKLYKFINVSLVVAYILSCAAMEHDWK